MMVDMVMMGDIVMKEDMGDDGGHGVMVDMMSRLMLFDYNSYSGEFDQLITDRDDEVAMKEGGAVPDAAHRGVVVPIPLAELKITGSSINPLYILDWTVCSR